MSQSFSTSNSFVPAPWALPPLPLRAMPLPGLDARYALDSAYASWPASLALPWAATPWAMTPWTPTAWGPSTSAPWGGVPSLGQVSSFMQTDSGASPWLVSGGVTRDSTLGLSGTVRAGVQVQVYDGNTLLGNAQVKGSTWSFTTPGLAEGQHQLNIKYVLGTQTQSDRLFATIDTHAVGSISRQIVTDTGASATIASGDSTTDHTLGLQGTAESGAVVQMYVDGSYRGNAQVQGGQWRYTTQQLSDGAHTFMAKVVDAAGNVLNTDSVSATVQPLVLGTVAQQLLTDTGLAASIASGGLTRDNTLGLQGTVAAGTTVDVYDGAKWLGRATSTGGNWSFNTSPLSDGVHNLNVKFVQGSSWQTKTVSAVVDTVAKGSLDAAFTTDTGSVSSGGSTTDHTLGLSGTVEAGGTVRVFQDGAFVGNASVTNGQWHYDTATLSDGLHTFSAQWSDLAGNQASSATTSVTVSTAAVSPTPTPTHAWSSTSGWGAVDVLGAINQATAQHLVNNRPTSGLAWGLAQANFDDAWSYGYTGKGVTVAVIDTGLDLANTALTQHLSKWSYDFVNRDSDVTDDNGHGTFVASEIVAAQGSAMGTGAAYDADLMVLKALNASGSGSASTLCEAIHYAVDHGADVINMSLGGGDYVGYSDALKYARDHDVLVVMAAGNSGGAEPVNPAKYAQTFNNCLAVGALKSTASGPAMASFSNLAGGTGAYNFVDAAGQDVVGFALNQQVAHWDGTSMATPYAAAAAALILSANSSLHADQVLQYMTASAQVI